MEEVAFPDRLPHLRGLGFDGEGGFYRKGVGFRRGRAFGDGEIPNAVKQPKILSLEIGIGMQLK